MLIFPKRKIILMMRGLFPRLSKSNRKELAKGLDNLEANKAAQSLWEIAVLWALTQKLSLVPHVSVPSINKHPDAEIDLGLDKKIILDVKTLSGNPFDFTEHLEVESQSIVAAANSIKPKSGDFITINYFVWEDRRNLVRPRRPSVEKGAANNPEFLIQLKVFLLANELQKVRINIVGVIVAEFTKSPFRPPIPIYYCPIQPTPQSVRNNLSDNLINDAVGKQLKHFKDTHYLGLVICDGGNEAISDPNRPAGNGSVSGADIMKYVIQESNVDFIVCLGRKDELSSEHIASVSNERVKTLAISFFFNPKLPQQISQTIETKLRDVLALLPAPLLHGRSAKSRMAQDSAIGSTRPYYAVPNHSQKQGEPAKMRTSSRAFIQFVSGELTPDEYFKKHIEPLKNAIELKGRKITAAKIEPLSEDRDDDHLVFELGDNLESLTFVEIENQL